MDTAQIRTFIAVAQTGSFLGAADVVHVTQSTVSARIRALEDELRVSLFNRGKKGASLTAAGVRFLKTATAMAQLWDQARLDVGLADDLVVSLRVGAQVSLWDGFMIPWLAWMQREAPEIAIQATMSDPIALTQKLEEGALDVAVLYRPQHRSGFKAREIFNEEIIMVTSDMASKDPVGSSYILTYWGPEFQRDHALHFPKMITPSLSMDLGTLGINLLVRSPGTAYFPRRIAQPHLDKGHMKVVEGAPVFKYASYAVISETLDEAYGKIVLQGLKSTAMFLR